MALAPDDLADLAKLLCEGLTLPGPRRLAWYDALPTNHLKPVLGQLLRQHDEAAAPAFETLPKLGDLAVPIDSVAAAGQLIGPYRLLKELGQGGMGSVWLAERTDANPRRQVALKLPRYAWGFGLAERMRRERDLAARLEHPHIARLYEAGVDEHGRPYLAFEYVDGCPIDRWCAVHGAHLGQKLQLFVQVARAVAYAHASLVVHRDLKPSNILVSADSQVHLLDFGIAKSLAEADADQTALTQWMGPAMTPTYASPEQLTGAPITVASDIYSLGIVLFELLTGKPPHRPRPGSLAMFTGVAVVECDLPQASSTVADKPLAKALKGELDAILAMALRPQPAQRYATAIALAEDVERHLAGERVLAQPDSAWRRWRRVARRHGPALALGATALVAVLVAAAAALVQAQRANAEAAAAGAVKKFVLDVFHVNGKDNPANAQLRQLPVELLLERGAKQIELGFADQPTLRADLHGELAAIFLDMASNRLAAQQARLRIEALDHSGASPSDRATARLVLARALANDDQLRAAESTAQDALSLSASTEAEPAARLVLCEVVARLGRYDEAAEQLRIVLASPRAARDPALHLDAVAMRAELLRWTNQLDEAAPLYLEVIDSSIQRDGPHAARAIDTRIRFANALFTANRPAEAKPHLTAALESMRAIGGDADIAATMTEAKIASLGSQIWSRPIEETEADFKRLEAALASHGRAVPEVLHAWMAFYRSIAYYSHTDLERAYAVGRPAIELLLPRTESAEQRGRLWNMLDSLAMETGRHDEADQFARNAKFEFDRAFGEGNLTAAWGPLDIAMNLSMAGRFDEAVAELTSALQSAPGDGAGDSDRRGFSINMLSLQRVQVEIDRGDYAAALRLLPPDIDPAKMPQGWDPRLFEARALCGSRDPRGLSAYEAALARLTPRLHANSHWLAWDRANLGLCALRAGERQRAAELAAQARETFRLHPGCAPYFKRPSALLDERLRQPVRTTPRVRFSASNASG